MIKIDGKKIAENIIGRLKDLGVSTDKRMAAVLVGDDKSSLSFLKIKERVARELGVVFDLYHLSSVITQDELEEKIRTLSNDEKVGGIIVQLPLPQRFNVDQVLSNINSAKDVDALTNGALVESPAVGTVKEILKEINWDWKDPPSPKASAGHSKNILVVGKGRLVGQPIIRWLRSSPEQCRRITIADSKTTDLNKLLSEADLIISGVGKENLIDLNLLKDGAVAIDFGFPPDIQKLEIAAPQGGASLASETGGKIFYTPTPGGTGPILVAKLFENFFNVI